VRGSVFAEVRYESIKIEADFGRTFNRKRTQVELRSLSLYSIIIVYAVHTSAVLYCQVNVLCWNKSCHLSPRVCYYLLLWKPSLQYELKLSRH
jgi:hypothetical protein